MSRALLRYMYLTGRVNMKSIEVTIQNLIGSGMDPKTENNPYLGFCYTSFQERATKVGGRGSERVGGAWGSFEKHERATQVRWGQRGMGWQDDRATCFAGPRRSHGGRMVASKSADLEGHLEALGSGRKVRELTTDTAYGVRR